MRMIRNLARRRLRTSLTIVGIAIGIWALVVFSSMANKINTLVAGGSHYYADKIVVSDGGDRRLGGAPMRLDLADQLRAIDGVDVVVPRVTMLVENIAGVGLRARPTRSSRAPVGADEGRETVADAASPRAGADGDRRGHERRRPRVRHRRQATRWRSATRSRCTAARSRSSGSWSPP